MGGSGADVEARYRWGIILTFLSPRQTEAVIYSKGYKACKKLKCFIIFILNIHLCSSLCDLDYIIIIGNNSGIFFCLDIIYITVTFSFTYYHLSECFTLIYIFI